MSCETEPVMESDDCGGARKVATYHNPSSFGERKLRNIVMYLTIESFGFAESCLECQLLILVGWSKGDDTALSRQ